MVGADVRVPWGVEIFPDQLWFVKADGERKSFGELAVLNIYLVGCP